MGEGRYPSRSVWEVHQRPGQTYMLTSPRIRHPADQTGFPTPTTTRRILHSPLSASLLDDETRPISFQPFHRRPRNHRLSPSPRPFLLQSAKPPSQLLARFLQKHAPKVQASRHTSQRCRSSRLSTHSSPTFFSELDCPNPHPCQAHPLRLVRLVGGWATRATLPCTNHWSEQALQRSPSLGMVTLHKDDATPATLN